MKSKNVNHREDVISSMFLSASIAMIFTLIVGTAAQFFDGIITSRFLGNDAYSGIALFGPFTGIVLMFASFFSTGNQILCSGCIGEGKKEEANSIFSFCVLAGLLTSLLLVLGCILIPDPILAICGVTKGNNPVLYDNMLSYMKGFAFGIPALMTIQIIGPMLVFDNGKVFFTISAVVLCISDIAGDFLNVLYFHRGNFGMGIATSLSVTIQLLMLIAYLSRKNGMFRFSLKEFRPAVIKNVAKTGFPALVQNLAVDLRELFINRINLLIALSSAALVARGVQYDINQILFCIGIGIGNTMMSMTGLYYSVNDRAGLRRLFSYGMKVSTCCSLIISAALFLLSPLIAGIYTTDSETLSLCVFGLRCMAAALTADVVSCVFADYLQAIRNRRLVVILNITDRLLLPVGSALLLGFTLGSKGILAAIPLGKFLLIGIIFLLICHHCKRIPRSTDDFLLVPEDFGGSSQSNLYGRIRTMEDVIRESYHTEAFCLQQGADPDTARKMALFMEEMAGNIVRHNKPDRPDKGKRFPLRQKQTGAEFRLFVDNEKICLTLRDYNHVFDPTAWYQAHQNTAPGEAAGIRLVMALAQKICYFSAFNSNNLIIWLNLKKQ